MRLKIPECLSEIDSEKIRFTSCADHNKQTLIDNNYTFSNESET